MQIFARAAMSKAFAAVQSVSRRQTMKQAVALKPHNMLKPNSKNFTKEIFSEANAKLKFQNFGGKMSGVGGRNPFTGLPTRQEPSPLKNALNSPLYQTSKSVALRVGELALEARLSANLGKMSEEGRDRFLEKADAKVKDAAAEANAELRSSLSERKEHFSKNVHNGSDLSREINQLEDNLLISRNEDLQANRVRSDRVSTLMDYKSDLLDIKVNAGLKSVPAVNGKEAERLGDLVKLNDEAKAAFRAETDTDKKIKLLDLLKNIADEIDATPERVFRRS